MNDQGQTNRGHYSSLETFGSWELPRLVGVLTLLGWDHEVAEHFVRRKAKASIVDGVEGGQAAARLIEEAILLDAPAPKVPRVADGPLEAALATLPWELRKATVVSVVPGITRLGPGEPARVAAAVGARTPTEPADGRPLLGELVAEAVADRAGRADPGFVDEARVAARQRRLRVVALVVAIVVVLVVVAVLAGRAVSDDGRADPAPGPGVLAPTQWVAVLREGPGPAPLAPEAFELGRVVGVYVFTDRWACYEGFPDASATQDWFLGLAATERDVVDGLLAELDRTPLVAAEVQPVCVQPPPDDGVPVLVDPLQPARP